VLHEIHSSVCGRWQDLHVLPPVHGCSQETSGMDREVKGEEVHSQRMNQLPNDRGEDGLKKNFLDITKLVRSVQRAEGNPDCFRKAEKVCDRLDCAWYRYCLGEDCAPQPGKGQHRKT
jgi:hypothetical protein